MPIYMWFEGVDGSVKRKAKNWIEIESAQVGVNRHVTSPTGRGTNREAAVPSVSEIVVTKFQDVSSKGLFRLALSGPGKKVVIEFVKLDKNGAEEAAYMSVELENTMISSFSSSGTSSGIPGPPMESLSLNFTKFTYTTVAPGKVTDPKQRQERAEWDLTEAR